MLLKGLQGKVHRQQNREAALLINRNKTKKDKQRACIVSATDMNFVFLSKLFLPLWWEHRVASASPYLLVTQSNTSTLHPA